MKVYIRSASAVSAQNTFGNAPFLTEPVAVTGTRLSAIEPDYKEFLDPKLARRMSRIIKMGVAAAMQCLRDADVSMPGAIITGTALGCQEDTITFLQRIIEMEEQMLPPTAFIQSTHNTVAAQIALVLKCHGYNNTFVHKGISFESALLDATMLLKEGDANDILVGGTEEMTDTAFKILTRLGLYKRWPISNLDLLNVKSNGTVSGEGAVFFTLTDKPSEDNLAELVANRTFFDASGNFDVDAKIKAFLAEHSSTIDNIDLVITGKNGDTKNDSVYEALDQSLFANTSKAYFKHLSGEYATSISFGLWLASNIIKQQTVPAVVTNGKINNDAPRKILIYNHYQNTYHSITLLSAC
ncbi:beta-ketoacyl synthase chain length factor [Mucilaginibacter antarcticus]|uniref:Beta-ketoacyl synthase chain length factor n=1 Tax=Mucilaginibacter antarcticus TaxID=1855725 RepID=A0ABW5XTV2_9SPHI